MAVQVEIKNNYEEHLKNQLEYFISLLFHYLHAPFDKQNFQVKTHDNVIKYQNILGSKGLFVVENFTYELLLSRIRPYRILEIVSAMLLERPIFIVSDNLDDMAIIMKSLISLIKPMNWVSTVVPIIPWNIAEGIIGIPNGALIGIHTHIWREYCEQNEDFISEDAYIFFLNEDRNVEVNEHPHLPNSVELEEFIYIFRNYLKDPEDGWEMKTNCAKLLNKIGITRAITLEDYLIYTQLKIDFEFFHTIFVKNLFNVTKFINFEVDPQSYIDKKQGCKIFDSDKFLDTLKGGNKAFVQRMVHTQLFDSFIDKVFKIHHNRLSGDEDDMEKVEYFLRW
jgi:hypothetical protein